MGVSDGVTGGWDQDHQAVSDGRGGAGHSRVSVVRVRRARLRSDLTFSFKKNITLMWFSCSSCQRFGGKLDMVQRINDESA